MPGAAYSAILCTALSLMLLLMGGDRSASIAISQPNASKFPAIRAEDWQSFDDAVHARARQFSGTLGYVIKDLNSGHVVSSQADRAFPSASLIKLPIMVAVFQAVEDKKLTLAQTLTLHRQDRKGGSGILKWSPVGSVFTVSELVEAMITHSDNTAAHMLVDQLGYDYLQQTFHKLGLQATEVHPEGFRLTSRRVDEDNMTSPADMAMLLEKIYTRQLVSEQASDDMLGILKRQHLRDRLPKYLPSGWMIAHKTGLLRRACHDVGIVFSPNGDYLICVLTNHDSTYKVAKRFIATMGRISFDYYQGGFHTPMVQTRRPVTTLPPAS